MPKENHKNSSKDSKNNLEEYQERIVTLEKQVKKIQEEKENYAKELELSKSVGKYELLFKSTGLGVIHRNRQGKIIYANPAATTILGVTNEKLLNIERFEPPVKNIYQDGKEMTASMHPAKKVFKTGKEIANTIIGVYNSRKKDYVWINLTAIPLIDHSGDVDIVYTVFEDISERLEKDELLINSIARSKALLTTIPDRILRVDKDGVILDFHGENQELFFREKIIIGKKIEHVFETGFYQLFLEKQKQFKYVGELILFEYQITSQKNKKYFFEVRVSNNELGEVTSIIRDVTNSKKSEKKINEAKRQLSTLMGNLEGMVYRCLADESWTMLFISDGVFDLSGYRVDEIIENARISFSDIIFPDDRKLVEDAVSKASETDERFSVEYRIVAKNGTIKWVIEQGITIKDSSNKTLFIEGYISDITERKLAQQQIESREARYRLLFNSLNEAVFVHPWKESAFQTFIEVNDIAIQRYGYTREEFLNLSPPNLSGKGEWDIVELDRIRESLKNFGRVRFETEHITKTGKVFPVVINANVIEINGKYFIQSIVRDVSEQKIAAEKLDHKSQIEKLISNISAEFVSSRGSEFDKVISLALQNISKMIHADRTYIFLIDEMRSKVVNSHEWCAKNVPSLLKGQKEIPKEQLNWWIDKFQKHEQIYIASLADLPAEAFRSADFGIQIEEKSGLYLPLFYREHLLGFIGFDVLEGSPGLNKSDFYLLYTLADMLAGVFYRRNFEEQLILAKEKAEESDRLKSTFLATMSHELRTPLNAIIGFSGLGEASTKKESYERWNKIINSSGKHLLNIIESIFDVSLLQAKEAKLEEEEFSLSDFYLTLQQYVKAEIKKHGKSNLTTQMFSFANSEVFITADKTKLMQLITNLLNNAIKYTNKGEIEYGYRVIDNDVLFSVSDSGIGIKDEDVDIIFDVFRQVEDPLVCSQSGVGLGLAICKEISELMNGELCLESKEGEGTTFYFKLSDVVVGEQEQSQKIEVLPPKLAGETILVVEDIEYNYLLINEMLSPTAARVIWAKNGQESIHLVNSESSISLILMDIKMPLMDGYEASRKILNAKPNIPIIAQTAYALKSDKKLIKEAGFKDYIPKPINEDLLYQLLSLYLPQNTA